MTRSTLLSSAARTAFDFIVFIGRFQIFHRGHLKQVERALEQAGTVVMLVGSSNRIRSMRHSFTYLERKEVIERAILEELGADALARVLIYPLPDKLYNINGWKAQTETIVNVATSDLVRPRIGIIGHERDHTSGYLRMFPWEFVVGAEYLGIAASTLRERLLTPSGDDLVGFSEFVPHATLDWLYSFQQTEAYENLCEDRSVILANQRKYGMGPFFAGDSVLVQGDDILTITRGARPNKGARAVPGGFLDKEHLWETMYECAVRELFEETNLADLGLTRADIDACYRAQYLFDDPHRSDRGRIISQAYLFELPPSFGRLQVEGRDDAADAEMTKQSSLVADQMFDDHAFLIDKMLTFLP